MTQRQDIINMLRANNDLSILKIEEFLEYLDDCGYLTEEGKKLRNAIWRQYIAE